MRRRVAATLTHATTGPESRDFIQCCTLEAMSVQRPKFRSPPVVETVLGVQFPPLPKLGNWHLGAYWELLGKNDWPFVEEAGPIRAQYERFGDARQHDLQISFGFGEAPTQRLRIRNKAQDRMIQVQNGRFHYNWLKREQTYPSYDAILPEFKDALQRFIGFLDQNEVGQPGFDQWEITYVNHIPQGTLWQSPDDWHQIFDALLAANTGNRAKLQFEGCTGVWRFEIPEKRGRLHVEINQGIQGDEQKVPIIRLKLTARGAVAEKDGMGYVDGLNLGHETIVKTFEAITSEKCHREWEIEHDDRES